MPKHEKQKFDFMKSFVQLCILICLCLLFNISESIGTTFYSSKLDTLNLPDSIFQFTNDCGAEAQICLGEGIDPFFLKVEVDGQEYFGNIGYCQEDTLFSYTLFTLFGGGNAGPYFLDSWSVNGQIYSGPFADVNELVALMNTNDQLGNWQYNPTTLLITGGVSGADYSLMTVTVLSLGGAKGFIGLNFGIQFSGASISLPVGKHEIILTDNLTNESDTSFIHLTCITPEIIEVDIPLVVTDTICFDLSQLTGPVASIENLCPDASGINVFFQIVNGVCLEYTGIGVGVDTFCAKICDIHGICDTAKYIVNVFDKPSITTKIINIYELQDTVVCLDLTGVVGNPISIVNYCSDSSNDDAELIIGASTFCITLTGLTEGSDTACIQVCTDFGSCDTTIFIINVKPLPQKDTVFINVSAGKSIVYCLDLSEIDFNVTSFVNYCPDASGINAIITIDTLSGCLTIAGIQPNTQDTACYVFCNDQLGICDTTIVIITIGAGNPPKIVDLTIEVGELTQYCIDTIGIPGMPVAIFNNCPFGSDGNADIVIDQSTFCVFALGLVPGVDSACIILCTDAGFCDTTIIKITVVENKLPQTITLNVYKGDTLSYCVNQNTLCSPIFSIDNACPGIINDNIVASINDSTLCIDFAGIEIGQDSLCLSLCCTSAICDTIIFIVNVLQKPNSDIVDITVEVGDSTTYCLDIANLCSPIIDIENLCPGSIPDNSSIEFDPNTLCINITGLSVGIDSLCLGINCGGVTDTLIIKINVINPQTNQTILVTVEKGDTLVYCFDQLTVCSPVLFLEDLCPGAIVDNSSISLDSNLCATIIGLVAGGQDSLCLAFCCANGCDTVTLIINVVEKPNPPTIVNLTIEVTDTIQYCIDISDLTTGVASIENICPTLNNGFTISSLDTTSLCFTFIGAVPNGQDIFCMVVCDSTGFCDTTVIFVNVLPKIITPEIVVLTVFEGDTISYCIDTTDLGGNIISIENICEGASGENAIVTIDSTTNCLNITGLLAFGTDTACIVICSSNGFCDTTTLIIHVVKDAYPDTLYFNVEQGNSLVYCFEPDSIGGNITSIVNICPNISGNNAAYFYTIQDSCITIVGILAGGTDTACFVICNDMGYCDTVTMITSVFKVTDQIIYDTLLINFTDSTCISIAGLDPNTITVTNECLGSSGTEVNFTINEITLCILYDGLALGNDTACIKISDASGNTINTTIIVTVVPPSPDVYIDTIGAGNTEIFCLDPSELAGNIVSVINFCPDDSNGNISIVINNTTGCITITGLVPGTDTLCLQYCDDLGVCDTTYAFITVPLPQIILIAIDDFDSTTVNTPVIINVLPNDIQPGGATVSVLPVSQGGVGPINGIVTLNNNGTFTYTPNNGFCGVDSFSYVLCLGTLCDTAIVTINVKCPDGLVIYNGFSPNGDGQNETFTIDGIQNYPNNNLKIYNRWGNLVYDKDKYNNDWGGTWVSDLVPDGTYFYLLDLGNGEVFKGYLQIFR